MDSNAEIFNYKNHKINAIDVYNLATSSTTPDETANNLIEQMEKESIFNAVSIKEIRQAKKSERNSLEPLASDCLTKEKKQ
jgi:hypothetical protein